MQITKQTITPKKAREYLTRNVSNRPLGIKWVQQLADIMLAGEWRLNGEAVKFNGNGDLIDGQHRLSACVKAEKPFESYVVVGLDHDAFDTLDRGKIRTNGDILARRGEKYCKHLAGTLHHVWRFESGNYSEAKSVRFRTSQMDDILTRHPGLRDCVQEAFSTTNKLIPISLAAALMYLTRQSDKAIADKFWSGLLGGEGLKRNMPEYWLRQRLIENLSSTATLPRDVIAALCIKAWNFAKSGKECKNLKLDAREKFPTIS